METSVCYIFNYVLRDKYIRPFPKDEFIDKVTDLLENNAKAASNFEGFKLVESYQQTREERNQRNGGFDTIDEDISSTDFAQGVDTSKLSKPNREDETPFLDVNYEKLKTKDSLTTTNKTVHTNKGLTMNDVEFTSKQRGFDNEFSELEQLAQATIQRRTLSSSSQQVNRRRNRYHDIVPFDATRVKLEKPLLVNNESESSDYINASFITDYVPLVMESNGQGLHNPNVSHTRENVRGDTSNSSYSKQHSNLPNSLGGQNQIEGTASQARYIAAQGPDEATIPLFWEMIWQQNVRVIVMLTNLVEGIGFHSVKCSMYWPPVVGSVRRYNNFEIQLYDVQEAPDYTVRRFDVSKRFRKRSGEGDCEGGNREIVHIQYTSWPDRSAPEEPEKILQLIDLTRVLSDQYMHRCQNTLSISSIKPAEKTLMSASTLNVADENIDNYYSAIKGTHNSAGPWLVHCSAGVGRTGNVNQLLHCTHFGFYATLIFLRLMKTIYHVLL